MRLTATKRVPSGDQRNTLTPFLRLVIRFASPPLIESTYTCARGGSALPAAVVPAAGAADGVDSGRDDENARDFPSGLQRGELEDCGELVNCQGARLPSVATPQIEEFRRFCARSTF